MPEASRKLIQACGRLIRKEADRGRVTILDRRLLTKRYGKGLLDALPPFTRRIE
ncbi:putative ATP-dependent helicase DinG [compost metagenome]